MADGLLFEEGANLAIKTIRQTPHSKLNMTPFQMHFGRKPRTAVTNLIGQPECLLSNWKKTLTNYISAQPTELQMFTINDSEEEMADYIILNDSKKRTRSVSREFKQFQFSEKENKPNALKCRLETNKPLTAVKETKHTITTSEGRIIRQKLASKPIKYQLSGQSEERQKPTNRCSRCGKFCHGEYCDTHKWVYGIPRDPQQPSSSHTLPTMPQKRSTYGDILETNEEMDISKSQTDTLADEIQEDQSPTVEKIPSEEDNRPETNTPSLATPIQCSASHGPCPAQKGDEPPTTPIRATVTAEGPPEAGVTNKDKRKIETKEIKLKNSKVTFEQPTDLRRSDKIKGAR